MPEATEALAEVVEVKLPKVPSPATPAAAASRATEARTLLDDFLVVLLMIGLPSFSGPAAGLVVCWSASVFCR